MSRAEARVARITAAIAAHFRMFGGGRDSGFNPVTHALRDAPPQFAAGVDVAQVVRFVLVRARRRRRRLTLGV